MAALVLQRQVEELLDRIGSVGPETAEQTTAAAALAEQLGKKLVGRHEIHTGQQPGQTVMRRGRSRARRGPPAGVARGTARRGP